jgi:hypothetical protein
MSRASMRRDVSAVWSGFVVCSSIIGEFRYCSATTTRGVKKIAIKRRQAGADQRPSLEADNHTVGAERELKTSAMRFQFHLDSLLVLEPQRATALISERPTRANLAVNAKSSRL